MLTYPSQVENQWSHTHIYIYIYIYKPTQFTWIELSEITKLCLRFYVL